MVKMSNSFKQKHRKENSKVGETVIFDHYGKNLSPFEAL